MTERIDEKDLPLVTAAPTDELRAVRGGKSVRVPIGSLPASAAVQAQIDALAAGQAAGQKVYRTWAELSGVTGSAGEGAQVIDDTGTHTDPVVGGTVANAGQYVWSDSPAGWRWVRPDLLPSVTSGLSRTQLLNSAVWLKPEALDLTTWSSTAIEVAQAIKGVKLEGAVPGVEYCIRTFCNDDGTYDDRISVQAVGSDAAFASNISNPSVTKSTTGLTTVVLTGAGGARVTLWIDYRQISSTGILVNVASSPLRIASSSVVDLVDEKTADVPALAAKVAGMGAYPYSNRLTNGHFAVGVPQQFTGAVTFSSPTPALQALGVERVASIASTNYIYTRDFVLKPEDALAYFLVAIYVESPDGTTWPDFARCVPYDSTPSLVNTSPQTYGYVDVGPNLRRYWGKGRFADSAEMVEARLGFSNMPPGCKFGGVTLVIDHAGPIDITLVPPDDWTGTAFTRKGMSVLQDRVKRLEDRGEVNHLQGKKIAMIGDSFVQSYGVAQALGTALGTAVDGFGFAGCRMANFTGAGNEWYDRMCMYKLADYIASGDFTDLIEAGEQQFLLNGDDKRPQIAAMASYDWGSVDYLLISFGTNDWAGNVPLGTPADSTGASFMGAINHAIATLQAAFPSLQILFVTPMWRQRHYPGDGKDSDFNTNSGGKYLIEFADAVISRANAHHVPAMDMYRNSGINAHNYTVMTSDGLHPSIPLGRDRWAGKVARWMISVT